MWRIVVWVMFTLVWAYSSSQTEVYSSSQTEELFDLPDCYENLTKPTGTFKINMKKFKGECYWGINPIPPPNATKSNVNIFIHYLFLHTNDVVTLHKNLNDAVNDSFPLVKPLFAQNGSVTVITDEEEVVIKLKGNGTYDRIFEVFYQAQSCAFPIPRELQYIHSPIYSKVNETSRECHYTYNQDPHFREIPTFTFEKFNFSSSSVTLDGTTHNGPYKNDGVDFFPQPDQHAMTIAVNLNVNSSEYFLLKMHLVDSSCSGFSEIKNDFPLVLQSPPALLNNGSFGTECRWVIKNPDGSKILGLAFDSLLFTSVFDVLAVNDGPSETSLPLLQITTSNRNLTMRQSIRSTGPYMWMAFKPLNFDSKISLNVTVHGQGGYHKGNGTISMKSTTGNDTIFLLEVDDEKVVLLNFTSSSFNPPATLSIYNGFDTSDLLTTLHGNVWYPILSKGSRMMVLATNFAVGSFSAEFKGVTSGCLHMSTLSTESYILSGNCNSTCMWVIPPQKVLDSDLLLNLQYISLEQEDEVQILRLDTAKTLLGAVTSNMSFVPRLIIQSQIGALIKVIRGSCREKPNDIVLVGHSSYIPACQKTMAPNPSELFQITSPLYPDTYPVLASCSWIVSTPNSNLLHLAFDKLKLKPNHCVTIQNSDNKTISYEGSQLPDDIFIKGGSVIEFNSNNCNKSETASLTTSEGFVLNGTVADCGAILESSSGEFNTSTAGNKTMCIWKVSVPATTGADVNVISYTVTKTDDKMNYELHVFDGASVRESEILNNTKSDIWSRTNNLIFVYKRLDVTQPSSVLVFKYNMISCNSTMQCENKMCMHPDWRCNGINDCGDYSDELKCKSVPVPPELKQTGYTAVSFWMTALAMIIVGIILGIAVPFFYQKYKNGQYRRFGDISVIE